MRFLSLSVIVLVALFACSNGFTREGGHSAAHFGGSMRGGHSTGGFSVSGGGRNFGKSFYAQHNYSHINSASHANFNRSFYQNHNYASVTNTGFNTRKGIGYRRTTGNNHIYNSNSNRSKTSEEWNNLNKITTMNRYHSRNHYYHNYNYNRNRRNWDRHHRYYHHDNHWWWNNHHPNWYYGGGLVYNDGDVYYDNNDNQTENIQDSNQESFAESQANQYDSLAEKAREDGKEELYDIYRQCASAERTLAKAYKYGDRNLLEVGNQELSKALARLNGYSDK